jgi:hypothetical protein
MIVGVRSMAADPPAGRNRLSGSQWQCLNLSIVMPGLGPGIHVFAKNKTWMATELGLPSSA